MEDSINLKKRIFKIREANNIDSGYLNPKKNVLFTKSIATIQNHSEKINIKSNTNDNYGEQFKFLANKFNEAIEVILELNDRVNMLKKLVYGKEGNTKKILHNKNRNKIKLGIASALIILFISSLFFPPIHLELTSLSKMDIWIFLNPLIRMVFYISAFCLVGTLIYLIHQYLVIWEVI